MPSWPPIPGSRTRICTININNEELLYEKSYMDKGYIYLKGKHNIKLKNILIAMCYCVCVLYSRHPLRH